MSALTGMISGLISGGQKLPTLDMAALYNTIKNAGAEQQQLINALPPEIQANLQQYAATQNAAGATYQGQIQNQGADYLSKTQGLYGPTSPAAMAENAANKEQIYSTVPGSQNAIREAMAATGGMARGNAGAALAQPYEAAASQYGQSVANVNARQTQAGQQATQQALQTVNTMQTDMFQQLFGMTKEQAQTILTTGNQALKDQLASLITESTNRENATLGIQGDQAQNAYQNAGIRNAQQLAVWNGLAGTAMEGAAGALNPTAISNGMGADPGYGMSDWFGSLNNPVSQGYAAYAAGGA